MHAHNVLSLPAGTVARARGAHEHRVAMKSRSARAPIPTSYTTAGAPTKASVRLLPLESPSRTMPDERRGRWTTFAFLACGRSRKEFPSGIEPFGRAAGFENMKHCSHSAAERECRQ